MNDLSASVPAASPTAMQLTPLVLLERAVVDGRDLDVIERLMDMAQRWEASEARKAFNKAMAAAKAEMPIILKNRKVDFSTQKGRTSYRHADLAEIVQAVVPVLGEHELWHRFETLNPPDEPITVTCVIGHNMGYEIRNTLRAGRDESGNKNAIQAVGSTVTYLSRYTLMAALGLAASEDDDSRSSEPIDQITDAQALDLQNRMDSAGLTARRFCERFAVDKVGDLPAAKLQEAIDAITSFAERATKP